MKDMKWITRGDVDGFFGLFIDNLLALLLIAVLCQYACGFPAAFINERILPGAALSILAGNLFYSWQARRLARRRGAEPATALPFGINTVSLLAFVFLVMAPVYHQTEDADLAWKVGLAACFLSGAIETAGAFLAPWIRRHTPRPALLSGLAGVALSFMALNFSFQIFASPAIGLVPAMLILAAYGARARLPLRLPAGLVAVAIGTAGAWTLRSLGLADFAVPADPVSLGFHLPGVTIGELASVLSRPEGWSYVSVVIPIALFNVIGSIQNLDSAEAAGDRYATRSSLLVNGATSVVASALGSPFPTSIYLGHPAWKAMGAAASYSALSGIVVAALCLTGGVTAILKVVPMDATLGILIWIAIVIVGQAFTESEKRHSIAVALGLLPAMAAWALNLIETSLRAAGTNLYDAYERFSGEVYVHGIISLYQGFLLVGIVLSAIMTHVIDRDFHKAALWSFTAALLSCVGLIHAYRLTPAGIQSSFGWMAAPWYVAAYSTIGLILFGFVFTGRWRTPSA